MERTAPVLPMRPGQPERISIAYMVQTNARPTPSAWTKIANAILASIGWFNELLIRTMSVLEGSRGGHQHGRQGRPGVTAGTGRAASTTLASTPVEEFNRRVTKTKMQQLEPGQTKQAASDKSFTSTSERDRPNRARAPPN